jgi:hypothetical protein
MTNGRFNFVLGFVALIVATLAGFALGQTLEPYYRSGHGQISLWRYLTKAGHTHGMLLGLVNIVFGMLIERSAGSDRIKQAASILTALTLCLPIGVSLRGITEGAQFAEVIAMAGGLSFIAACIVMMIASISRNR